MSGMGAMGMTPTERETLDLPELRLRRAQRILGAELVIATVAVVAFLPASPADQSSIGSAGWAVLAVVAAIQIAAGIYLLRATAVVSRDPQLAAIWGLAIAIAIFVWLTGGEESPYEPLFVLTAAAVGAQGPRRTAVLAVAVMALVCTPLFYADANANDVVRFIVTGLLTALLMAFVTWVAREIREEGIDQRAETETAVHTADELRRLDEAKDRFIATAAHELRSPLSVILMQSDELLAGEAGAITDEQHDLLDVTKRSAERLDRVVVDLLDLAQMDAGAFTIHRSDFSVSESLGHLCDEFASSAAARDVRIVKQLEEDIAVNADRARLELVFANVLSNAIKYSRDGGEVRLSAVRHGDEAVVEVADDGVGIPDDEIGHVGERFFRAATALGTKGTGLGLAIAREILELHSGKLEIASREGLGTTVVIRLPVGEPSGEPEPAPRPDRERRRGAGVDQAR